MSKPVLIAAAIIVVPCILAWLWSLWNISRTAAAHQDLAEPQAFDEFTDDITLETLGKGWQDTFDRIEARKER